MLGKGITLRGIEVFEALARCGSVAQAARLTGLSQPAVSQQMRNLESAIGADLIDHTRRPMRLTSAGETFLRHAGVALTALRLAQSELTIMDLAHLSDLSLGVIDDFDNDLTPRLATILADSMTGCRFRMITAGSNQLTAAVHDQTLHMALSASSGQAMEGVVEHPLALDPFMIVCPADTDATSDTLLAGGALPFLRYEAEQLIGRQIEAHLSAHRIALPTRFEIGSHLALMAMVARGIGWAITTPLGYMRAARFRDAITARPLPLPPLERQISLYAGAGWADAVPRDIARTTRQLLQTHMVAPALVDLPWLSESLRVIDA
jgi:DNA-binding transcriptional LysR family regulator